MTGKLFFTGDEKGEHPGPTYFRDKNDDVITSFPFTSRRPKVAIFADIMKIVTMFINNIFLNSKKVKRIRNYISKRSLYLYFVIEQNFLIFGGKILMSAELKECVT